MLILTVATTYKNRARMDMLIYTLKVDDLQKCFLHIYIHLLKINFIQYISI